MLLVIPISKNDIDNAVELSKLIRDLDQGKFNHPIVTIFSSVLNQEKKKEIQNILSKSTKKTYLSFTIDCDESGWPISANDMFAKTCHLIENSKHIKDLGENAWYWFEVDNTPLKPKWLDTLEEEYKQSGKLFMGAANVYNTDGILTMMGTGIYPMDLSKHLSFYKSLDKSIAFDVFLRHQTKQSLHHTNLIHWSWDSHNYKKIGSNIVGKNKGIGKASLIFKEVPILPFHVISHGCKDLSLLKIVREINLI